MLVGTFMAFDRHMNIVLGDTEEYRRIKSKKGQVETSRFILTDESNAMILIEMLYLK